MNVCYSGHITSGRHKTVIILQPFCKKLNCWSPSWCTQSFYYIEATEHMLNYIFIDMKKPDLAYHWSLEAVDESLRLLERFWCVKCFLSCYICHKSLFLSKTAHMFLYLEIQYFRNVHLYEQIHLCLLWDYVSLESFFLDKIINFITLLLQSTNLT